MQQFKKITFRIVQLILLFLKRCFRENIVCIKTVMDCLMSHKNKPYIKFDINNYYFCISNEKYESKSL